MSLKKNPKINLTKPNDLWHFFIDFFSFDFSPILSRFLEEFLIMRKILFVGMILFLSSACLPHIGSLPEKNHSDLISKEETQPSLFTQSELEDFFSQEPAFISNRNTSSSLRLQYQKARLVWSLELPISDESNDDFNLEILPGDRRKKEKTLTFPLSSMPKLNSLSNIFKRQLGIISPIGSPGLKNTSPS